MTKQLDEIINVIKRAANKVKDTRMLKRAEVTVKAKQTANKVASMKSNMAKIAKSNVSNISRAAKKPDYSPSKLVKLTPASTATAVKFKAGEKLKSAGGAIKSFAGKNKKAIGGAVAGAAAMAGISYAAKKLKQRRQQRSNIDLQRRKIAG